MKCLKTFLIASLCLKKPKKGKIDFLPREKKIDRGHHWQAFGRIARLTNYTIIRLHI